MLLIKLRTFLKSLLFHIWSGFPKSTEQEIEDRYVTCILCEKFNREKQECGVCGCAVSRKSIFLNKLAWADQECPIGKWSKIKR
jgi:uncharacterized paraquat-inducible protein A